MSMFLLRRQCMWPGCVVKIIGNQSACGPCARVLCADHIKSPQHGCADLQSSFKAARRTDRAYWAPVLAALRMASIAAQATALRPGHSCEVNVPSTFDQLRAVGMAGMLNAHFPIVFDDGTKWLVRIRRRQLWGPLSEMQRLIDQSEVATMKHLKAAGLPVPDAWMPIEDKETSAGDRPFYFFVECCNGAPFPAQAGPLVPRYTTQTHLERVISDYAAFQVKVAGLPFDAIGCILPGNHVDGTISTTIGPLPRFCRPDPPHQLGPYNTQKARYCEQIDTILSAIASRQLWSQHTLRAYLSFLHARHIVCELPEMDKEETQFFIKYADDKGDIFLTSDAGTEAVIDWEWAYTTTAAEAFSSPHFCYISRDYRNGSNDLSPEEQFLVAAYRRLGRNDLAGYAENGRIYNRLRDLLGGSFTLETLNGLSIAAGCRSPRVVDRRGLSIAAGWCSGDAAPSTGKEWTAWAIECYKDDETLAALLVEKG